MNSYKRLSPGRQLTLTSLLLMVAGNIMFAFAVNMIIVPINLYNGGFTGIAQLLKFAAIHLLNSSGYVFGLDLLGVLFFLINIPLFVVAYKVVGREFCVTSLISIGLQSMCVSLMPVPDKPIINDMLTACLVGGVLAGTGAGLVLRSGSSGGGNDIIGVALAKTHPNVHIGAISIFINAFILGICFFLFNIEVVIYSMIYSVFVSIFIDRMYVQNINIQAMIFTKKYGVSDAIIRELGRGVTNWNGAGAYTGEVSYILVTVISKYEVSRLVNIAKEIDPHCFIITTEGANIYGNFTKRLTSKEIRNAIITPADNCTCKADVKDADDRDPTQSL